MSISIICEHCEGPNEQTHAACTCSCHIYRKEIARLQTELAESQWLWRGSLEAQGELEKTIDRQAQTIRARQQSWHKMKERLERAEKELGEVKQQLADTQNQQSQLIRRFERKMQEYSGIGLCAEMHKFQPDVGFSIGDKSDYCRCGYHRLAMCHWEA